MRGGFLNRFANKIAVVALTTFLVTGSGVAIIEADANVPAPNPCAAGWEYIGTNCERTFYYTGDRQTFNVPSGVKNLSFVAAGGRGGVYSSGSWNAEASSGAVVSGVLPVQSGDVLNLYVGGNGASVKGGWNGGGDGNWVHFWKSMPTTNQLRDPAGSGYSAAGLGGGGATDIRVNGTALSNRKVVAAGGGGSGIYRICSPEGWIYWEQPGVGQPATCSSTTPVYGAMALGPGVTRNARAEASGFGNNTFGVTATNVAGGARGSLMTPNNWVGCQTTNYSGAGSLGQGGGGGSVASM
ncbi:MAG: hypothetical protein RI933_111, partial [Actinomycetota bacterium]